MIHALPGMGGDRRMYQGAWTTLPNFIPYDWPDYQGETTLDEVARLTCEAKGIQDGDILVGSSLGGMVACEIAKIKNISQLVLIGSAVNKNEISHLLSVLYPLMQVAPVEWMKRCAAKIQNNVMQMFSSSDTLFMRAMCSAIIKWEGLGNALIPVHRIHGMHDWVIPMPDKVDLVLNGGHLIAMTHAAECVDYVCRHLS